MTATTSTETKSFFGKRFLTDILENKKILIINFVLELLGLPVISIVALIAAYYDKLSEEKEIYYDITLFLLPFVFIGAGTILLSIGLGFVMALFNFNYLYRKSLVDMNYSLPLSNTQRFFSDYLSGLTMYIIPVIISVILSFVILGIGNVFIDIEGFWSIMPHIIKAGMIVIVGMIMIYTLSVFAIVFTGSTFEAIFSILAVNAMIPATICCVWLAIVTTSSYGMVGESIFYSPVFSATSPIGASVFFFMYLFQAVEDGLDGTVHSYYESMYIRWMILAVIMTAVYLIAAFLLYKLRKAENVSKPYVYKAFFYAIGAMTVFCIMSLLMATSINIISAIISGIIICGIGWFIMEVIARRGFKRFWTVPIGFAAVICSVFLVCGICKITDGFGAPRHVPSSLSVESVSIDVNDDSILPYEISNITFRDKDVIKSITALNKEAVDRHYHFDKYIYNDIENIDREYDRYDSQNIEITYQTLYGATVKRKYTVMSSMLSGVTEAILCSDEYADYASKKIVIDAANNSTSNYIRSLDTIKEEKKGGKITISNKIGQTGDTISLTNDSLMKLREAYKMDIMNMTPSQLENSSVYCYFGSYWVLDSFDNTKDFLAARDISIPAITISDISNGNSGTWTTTNVEVINNPRFYSRPKSFFGKDADSAKTYRYYYYDYGSDDEDKYSELDGITCAFANDNRSYYTSYNDFNSDAYVTDELVMLLNEATPLVFNEKPIAIVHSNNYTLFIRDTAENRTLLKKHYYGS